MGFMMKLIKTGIVGAIVFYVTWLGCLMLLPFGMDISVWSDLQIRLVAAGVALVAAWLVWNKGG